MAQFFADGEELACEVFQGRVGFKTEEELVTEGVKANSGRLGRMTFEFTTANVLNGNRRIYPTEVFQLALAGLVERIKRDVVFGNLDHPSIWDPESLIIKLSDAAVKLVEAKMTSDEDIKLILDILDNKHGAQLVSVLKVKGNPGVSQRAMAAWRDPTEAERERFKIPENEFVRVAEVLRLITYDIVSEPGFHDADGATVTEHRKGDPPMKLTIEIIKAQAPEVFAALVAEAKTVAEASLEQEIEERKPKIVEEAVASVNEELEKATSQNESTIKALEALKPTMVALGIVNEQITDTEAAARVATAEAEVATLKGEKAALETQLADLQKKVDASEAKDRVVEGIRAVSKQFKGDPFHDQIVRQVAAENIADTEKALAKALEIKTFIDGLNVKPDNEGEKPKGDDETKDVASVVESLINGNNADPSKANGSGTEEIATEHQVGLNILKAGVPVMGGTSI